MTEEKVEEKLPEGQIKVKKPSGIVMVVNDCADVRKMIKNLGWKVIK